MSVSPIAKWIGCICLWLWIMVVFFVYLGVNLENVAYCLKVYTILFSHVQTLLLVLIPCAIISFAAAAIYITKALISRRG